MRNHAVFRRIHVSFLMLMNWAIQQCYRKQYLRRHNASRKRQSSNNTINNILSLETLIFWYFPKYFQINLITPHHIEKLEADGYAKWVLYILKAFSTNSAKSVSQW